MKLDYSKINQIAQESRSLRINNTPQSRNIQVWVDVEDGSVEYEELLDSNSHVEIGSGCVTVGYLHGPVSAQKLADLARESLYCSILGQADVIALDKIIRDADSKEDAIDKMTAYIRDGHTPPVFEEEDFAKAAKCYYRMAFMVQGPKTKYEP